MGQHGRVDAQIKNSQIRLLIECKVDAPYDADQIERYLRYANTVKARVIAIVPALQAIHISEPTHDSFAGIFTWEDIYTWLNKTLGVLNPILQPHIESLLALMRHYRLEPIERSIATWKDESVHTVLDKGACRSTVPPEPDRGYATKQRFPHYEDIRTFHTQGFVGINICNTSDLLTDQTETHPASHRPFFLWRSFALLRIPLFYEAVSISLYWPFFGFLPNGAKGATIFS